MNSVLVLPLSPCIVTTISMFVDMMSGDLQEKFSCPPLLIKSCSHQKRWMPYCFSYFPTQQEEGFYLPPLCSDSQQKAYDSANEKPQYMGLPVYSSGPSAQNRPPSSAPSSIKECCSPLFLGHA